MHSSYMKTGIMNIHFITFTAEVSIPVMVSVAVCSHYTALNSFFSSIIVSPFKVFHTCTSPLIGIFV